MKQAVSSSNVTYGRQTDTLIMLRQMLIRLCLIKQMNPRGEQLEIRQRLNYMVDEVSGGANNHRRGILWIMLNRDSCQSLGSGPPLLD